MGKGSKKNFRRHVNGPLTLCSINSEQAQKPLLEYLRQNLQIRRGHKLMRIVREQRLCIDGKILVFQEQLCVQIYFRQCPHVYRHIASDKALNVIAASIRGRMTSALCDARKKEMAKSSSTHHTRKHGQASQCT